MYDLDVSPPRFLYAIGKQGRGAGEFELPCDVTTSSNRLLVSEERRVQVLSLNGAPKQVLTIPGANSLVGLCTLNAKGRRVFVLDHYARTIHTLLRNEETRCQEAMTGKAGEVEAVEAVNTAVLADEERPSKPLPSGTSLPDTSKPPAPTVVRLRGGETVPIPPHTAVVVSGTLKSARRARSRRPSAAPARSASTGRSKKQVTSQGPRPWSGHARIRANGSMDGRVVEILLD